VFVVEDQEMVRTFVVQALKSYGYRVIEAANGEDALRAAASLPEPVQVLVTDVHHAADVRSRACGSTEAGLAWPPGALHVGLYRPCGASPERAGHPHNSKSVKAQ
jgi:hypothetical protein